MKTPELSWKEIQKKIKDNYNKNNVNISCGNNLYIRITGKDKKMYWYERMPNRSLKIIGEFDKIPLSVARKRISKNNLQKQTIFTTEYQFDTIATKWFDLKKRNIAKPTKAKYQYILKKIAPFNKLNIQQLDASLAKKILLGLDIKKSYSKATINIICSIMNYAVELELIENHNLDSLKKSELLNPQYKKGGYKWKPLENFEEIFKTILKHSKIQPLYIYYYLLIAMLCIRPGECKNLKYEYFDLQNKRLNIPGSVMKVKRAEPFSIPLTKYTIALFELIKQDQENKKITSAYLFTNQERHVGQLAALFRGNVIWTECLKGVVTLHGFRKSARSWMAEHDIPLEIAASCLDHKIHTGADSIYQLSDLFKKRIPVIEAWNQAVFDHLPKKIQDMFDFS